MYINITKHNQSMHKYINQQIAELGGPAAEEAAP